MNRKSLKFVLITLITLACTGAAYAQACAPVSCLDVNANAAMNGTSFGLEVVLDGSQSTANAFVQDSTPDVNMETVYRASFLFNVNDMTAIVGARHLIASLATLSSNGARAFTLQLRKTAATWDVRVFASLTASATQRRSITPIPLSTDQPQRITMEWTSASGPGVADGFIRLTVSDPDGSNAVFEERSDILNWTQTARNMKLGHIGASIDTPSSGSHYYDEFESFRTLAP